jgi:hypothetical protein
VGGGAEGPAADRLARLEKTNVRLIWLAPDRADPPRRRKGASARRERQPAAGSWAAIESDNKARARQWWLSALSVSHIKSGLCGGFVWARGALNRQKRRFPARADGRALLAAQGAAGAKPARPHAARRTQAWRIRS